MPVEPTPQTPFRLEQAEHIAGGMLDATKRLKEHRDFKNLLQAKQAEAIKIRNQELAHQKPKQTTEVKKPTVSAGQLEAAMKLNLDRTIKTTMATPKGAFVQPWHPTMPNGMSGNVPSADIGLIAAAALVTAKNLLGRPRPTQSKPRHKKIK